MQQIAAASHFLLIIINNSYLTNSRKGNGELVMKPLQLMLNAKLHNLNKSSKIVKTFDLYTKL